MPPIRVLKRTTIYRGHIIQLFREVLNIGSRRIVRETVQHPGAVVVVPLIDPSHVVFVRQYRRAVSRELLELPAGTLEVGEARLACARRELQEETGWRARRMRRIGQFYAAPGITSEQLTVFLASGLTRGVSEPDPGELVTPVVLSFDRALRNIRSGAICDAKTIIGILFAERIVRASFLET